MAKIKGVHRRAVAVGDLLKQHLVCGRLGSDNALAGGSIYRNDVLHDGSPLFVGQIFSRSRFQDVCTTSGKWFRAR
jgi:hypothetical protein